MSNKKTNATNRLLAWTLILSLLPLGLQNVAHADVVTSQDLAAAVAIDVKRDQLKTFMARSDVKSKLLDLGVDPSNIDSRVDSLTDAEVLQMHDQIDDMPAGGVFGAVIAILVIFILLDVAGATDIFPGV